MVISALRKHYLKQPNKHTFLAIFIDYRENRPDRNLLRESRFRPSLNAKKRGFFDYWDINEKPPVITGGNFSNAGELQAYTLLSF